MSLNLSTHESGYRAVTLDGYMNCKNVAIPYFGMIAYRSPFVIDIKLRPQSHIHLFC